jgi:hypothetical protein
VYIMTRRTISQRAESFGLETDSSWALPALRLVFSAPRVYDPLIDAWDTRYPGTHTAMNRLVRGGWVARQDRLIVDTRTGAAATTVGKKVERFVTTAAGRRLLAAAEEDLRNLGDEFPHLSEANSLGVVRILTLCALDGTDARVGISAVHAAERSGLSDRTGRWWVRHLLQRGMLRLLPEKVADTREVVPGHVRPTAVLCQQLRDVLLEHPHLAHLAVEFRLSRSKFLPDIDPSRIGIVGATDFDHDVTAQVLLAAMARSPRAVVEGVFAVEPRFHLPLASGPSPQRFDAAGRGWTNYLPDAEYRERSAENRITRAVLEYERHQSRREAWSHIEKFLGALYLRALPGERAILRFVVDTPARARGYVALIEAFATHVLDDPQVLPPNPVTLAVADIATVLDAPDALDERRWFRIELGADTGGTPVLHDPAQSPYDDFFGRT